MSLRRAFFLAIAAGALLRIALTWTSIGTVDMLLWFRFSERIASHGIFGAYTTTSLLNHPPLALLIVHAMDRFANLTGIEFTSVFRTVTGLADLVTVLALARMSGPREHAAPLLFYLSPAAIFVSAFHGNTDPLMMMLVVLAVAAVMRERPIAGGFLLAAAVGIKVLPLFVGPLLLLACRDLRARIRFLVAALAGAALIFVPAMIVLGPSFLKQIFGYAGFVKNAWGIPLVLYRLGIGGDASWLIVVMIAAVAAVWYRQRRAAPDARELLASVGITYLLILFIAPGFGVQYLYWPLPFIAYALPRMFALVAHGAISIYLFTTYTVWSRAFPWWFAEHTPPAEMNAILGKAGLALWVMFGVAAIVGLRRLRRA